MLGEFPLANFAFLLFAFLLAVVVTLKIKNQVNGLFLVAELF